MVAPHTRLQLLKIDLEGTEGTDVDEPVLGGSHGILHEAVHVLNLALSDFHVVILDVDLGKRVMHLKP